jgi:hypothetical protein
VTVTEYKHFAASCPRSTTSPKLIILSAIYQSKRDASSCSKDLTHVVRKICFDKESCSFSVNNEVLQHDPCYNTLKELQITYTCSAHRGKPSSYIQKPVYIRSFSCLDIFGPVLSNSDSLHNDIHRSKFTSDETIVGIQFIIRDFKRAMLTRVPYS